MTDETTVLSAASIARYMRATGWTHGRQGSHGAMWTRGDVEFSVPHEDHNPSWLREVVGRLASAEGRTPEETAAAIAEHKAAPLVMPADELAAVGTVAEACGPVASAGVPVPDDSGRTLPSAPEKAQPHAATVTDQDVTAALLADVQFHKASRSLVWTSPSSEAVRAMLEAVTPRLVAAERERAERAEAKLEHAKAALAGDNEGIRLWMLDCNALAAKYWDRVQSAEAKLAEVRQCCQEAAGIADLIVRSGGKPIKASPLIDAILAIIGTEEEPFTPDCGQPTDADRAIAARATGGGIRSREVQPRFSEEGADHA